MAHILYLKNNETGKMVPLTRTYDNKKQLDRNKRAIQKGIERRGLTHITVHEKKL